jgi:hypothetical protein
MVEKPEMSGLMEAEFLRAKGPAILQPRAEPWVVVLG